MKRDVDHTVAPGNPEVGSGTGQGEASVPVGNAEAATNPTFPIDTEELLKAERVETALRLLPALTVLNIPLALVFTLHYFVLSAHPWQMLGLMIVAWLAVILFVIAYFLVRRGHLETAAYLIVLPINLAALMGAAWVDGWLLPSILLTLVSLHYARLLAGRAQNWTFIGIVAVTLVTAVWLAAFEVFPLLAIPLGIRVGAWLFYGLAVLFTIGLMLDLRDYRYERAMVAARESEQALLTEQAELQARTGDLERRARYLERITLLSQEVSAIYDVVELLEVVVNLIAEQFRFIHVAMFMPSEDQQWMVLAAAAGETGRTLVAEGYRISIGGRTAVGEAARTSKPQVVNNLTQSRWLQDEAAVPGAQALLALPLLARSDRVVGVLELRSEETFAFDEDDVVIFRILADQIAMALHTVRLFVRLQESLDAQRQVVGETSWEAWRDWMRANPNPGYRYRAADSMDDAEGEVVPLETAGEALPSGEGGPGNAEVQVPLLTGRGRNLGQIVARKSGTWTEEENALLRTLVQQLQQTLENARLYQDTRRRAVREQLTRQVTDDIRAALSVEDAIRRAVTHLAQVAGSAEVTARLGTQRSLLTQSPPNEPSEGEAYE